MTLQEKEDPGDSGCPLDLVSLNCCRHGGGALSSQAGDQG